MQKSVHFRFCRHPEYLSVGTKILFREGTTKGIGTVTKVMAVNSSALKVPIINPQGTELNYKPNSV